MADRLLKAREVADALGISRRTFYRLAFFRARAVYVTDRAPRWSAADVELYKALRVQGRAEGRAA